MGRKDFVLRNVFAKWIGIVIVTGLQFVSRKIFISFFSDDLLGLGSLLQSVISMLSLLELGVGSAIYYSLYEPLAKNDYQKIEAIMALYKKIYTGIGVIVLIAGLCMLPVLAIFVDTSVEIFTVRVSFLILLTDTVFSYFMAYRRNIFNADQKEYFCTNVDTVATAVATITQITLTIITESYYLYLVGKVVWTVLANVFIYLASNKRYSYILKKSNYQLSDEYMQKFKMDVKTLCISNISTYLVFGTDNLLISSYVGVGSVFIYSNYHMIINVVNKLFHNIFSSAQASIGNYIVENNKEKVYVLFDNIFFVNYLITCFTSVSLFTMFNSFMEIWLGEKYVWPMYIVAVLVINNYLRFINQASTVFRNAIGLYSPYRFYKYWGFIEGVVNLIVSLLLVKVFIGQEILGIFLGTTVSTFFVFTFAGNHALFKYYFGMEKMRDFIKKYFLYLLFTISFSFVTFGLLNLCSPQNKLCALLISGVISIFVPNALNIVLFRRSKQFLFFLSIIRRVKND